MAKIKKTNVMHLLDKEHVRYTVKTYEYTEDDLSGIHAAAEIGLNPEHVFKTLVGEGNKTGPVFFCIPVHKELDLKKAAHASGNKNVRLIHVKELPGLTGYLRGGCSPIGMKKAFPVYIDAAAGPLDIISISAGRRGMQVLLAPSDMINVTGATLADLITDNITLEKGRVR
mgnify:FL=1